MLLYKVASNNLAMFLAGLDLRRGRVPADPAGVVAGAAARAASEPASRRHRAALPAGDCAVEVVSQALTVTAANRRRDGRINSNWPRQISCELARVSVAAVVSGP